MPTMAALPLALQLGLGVGYVCYLMVHMETRRSHSTLDATFLSFIFGVPALVPVTVGVGSLPLNVIFGAMMSLGMAILWRGGVREQWFRHKPKLGLGTDDGRHFAWEGLLTRQDLRTSQISVHTADGRILYLNDRTRYAASPFEGLYLGSDGSILMVVEEEELPDGREEKRADIVDPTWRTRLTYIPAEQIRRVNIRIP